MSWIAAGGGLAVTIPEGAVVQGAPSGQIIRVGDGAQNLPAPILPQAGRAVPALTQDAPADIIGGWVRLWVAGFLADHPAWDGIICAQQGDISHWLHISADEVVSCQSFLTPRLIAALDGAEMAEPAAITDTMSRPERLAGQLRVAEVTGSAAHITGHLIGAELAAARPYWLGQQVAVIGETAGVARYASAIAAQGGPVATAPVADVLPKGLGALARTLKLEG